MSVAEEGELSVRRRARLRRGRRILVAAAMLVALALLGLWFARKPIARGEADRWLAAAHVPARYTIGGLGLGRQRLTDVVIGDPAHPDLVADWLETRTDWGLHGPYLAEVRGGHVRVRARWADGRLSLGSLDRLIPTGGAGKPLSLPALALDVADLRARVDTPWGVVGAKLIGRGRLDDGFDGQLAATGDRLGGGCGADHPEGAWQVRTRGAALTEPASVTLRGATQAAGLRCAGATAGYANANGTATLTLGDRLDWSIEQDVAVTQVRYPAGSVRAVAGRITLAGGGGAALAGPVSLTAADATAGSLRVAQATLDGSVAGDAARGRGFAGGLSWKGAHASAAMPSLAGGVPNTPIAPLLRRLTKAARAAATDSAGDAQVTLRVGPHGVTAAATRVAATAASGAHLSFAGARGLVWSPAMGLLVDGTATLGGGGLPEATVRVSQDAPARLRGTIVVAPYLAGNAGLALSPIAFAQTAAGWRVVTRATLSGPLGGGRVDGLALPIDLRWRGADVALAGGCAPLSWRRIASAGLTLDPGGVRLCPDGGALLTVAAGRVGGGARIAAARLSGRLGTTPVTLSATGARLRLAERTFTLDGVDARLGAPDRVTRLTVGTLDGRVASAGIGGHFAQAGGQIGAVPLVMSGAAGAWTLASGALAVDGALTIADTQSPARFQPMAAQAVRLTLANGRIDATAQLHEPTTGRQVADVVIRHDLSDGTGAAELTVAGVSFDKGLQPDQLTRLTFGVIADVRGTLSGEGHIAWRPAGVTSTGVFRTAGTDLAAAFGPVAGLAGEVRFDDLLALESAPDQRVTIRSINPGIPVTDGVVTFRTLPGARVDVAGARWPFAGGELVLAPTLLDFSGKAERRMTFRVTGIAADQFLQSFDFKNLDATGTFDGVLPMVFDADGGRIEDGRLAVREGGGGLAYVGAVSQKDLGFWANLAFNALKSLRYRSLGITMNGPLAGEMVTEVRFAGVSQGQGAKSNFLIRRLQRLPFVFNIKIKAPFRGLLDATASFYDPKRLIERNLPALIERQNQPIQPPASETKP